MTDFQIEGPTILLPVLIFQNQKLFERSTPISLTAIWSTARRKAMGSFFNDSESGRGGERLTTFGGREPRISPALYAVDLQPRSQPEQPVDRGPFDFQNPTGLREHRLDALFDLT